MPSLVREIGGGVGRGARSPLPPRKLTAEQEEQRQGGRQGLEETARTVGRCCEDLLGSLKARIGCWGRDMEKRAGSGAPVASPNPESPRQEVLGQSNPVRPPPPAQEHEESGDPKNLLCSSFWGHASGGWDGRQPQHQEKSPRPASLGPCLNFPTVSSS